MPDEVHVNDIGTIFRVTIVESGVAVDIASTTTHALLFQRPEEGVTVTQVASFTNVGTDGQMEYKGTSGDIDTVGRWKLQAHLIFPNGDDFRSNIAIFDVHPNL